MYLNFTRIGKVSIGAHVFIGAGSIILPGVSIGNDVVIGVGSIVTHDVPPGSVAVGNPARVICSIEDFLKRKKKEMEIYPCFGEEYQDVNNITDKMKKEMNDRMKDRFGFII
jgi:maltose O-acetyltransferase